MADQDHFFSGSRYHLFYWPVTVVKVTFSWANINFRGHISLFGGIYSYVSDKDHISVADITF